MNRNLVQVNLHGDWGGIPNNWSLAISSVGEAMTAIQSNTKKLFKHLLDKTKQNVRYAIIINGKNYYTDTPPDLNKPETIYNSELRIKKSNLKTIDIIPVLEGADSKTLGIVTIILGAVLVILGLFVPALEPYAASLITIGIGLLAAGAFALLAKPPGYEDFREIDQGGKASYLFAGPQNVIGEGGPVPLGYGKLIVGSQVVAAAYVVRDFNTEDTSQYLRDEYGNIIFVPKEHLIRVRD